MANTPRDLTIITLTHAAGAQLKYWIDGVNREAGKRVLTKAGRVDELRQKLASHYNLDLSTLPTTPAPAGPKTLDADIQKRQWSHLRQLGDAWKEAPDSFRLCERQELHPCLQQGLQTTLALSTSARPDSTSGMLSPSSFPTHEIERAPPETVHAWLQAAKDGNTDALAMLFQLHSIVSSRLPFVPSMLTATSSALPMPPLPPSSLTPENMRPRGCTNAAAAPGDKAILASGELVIEALEHAMNLQEVVEQLERGDVQRIRDKYGPQQGRASDRIWPRIKVTVNRRERLYHQLKDPGEFNSDKERFFKFFTATHHTSMPAGGRKRKVAEGDSGMVPYRRIVEAIPHRDKDIREERGSSAYWDGTGSFSSQRWHERWGNLNNWEIWRGLKKEYY